MFEEQVGAGIAELERRVPDFRQLIDVETLNMNDPDHCVLGQVGLKLGLGDYYAVARAWGWNPLVDFYGADDPSDVPVVALGFGCRSEYETLTTEWKRALATA